MLCVGLHAIPHRATDAWTKHKCNTHSHRNETVVICILEYQMLSNETKRNETMSVLAWEAFYSDSAAVVVTYTHTHVSTWACIITAYSKPYSVYHSIRNIRWFIVGRVCSSCCRLRLVRNIHSSRIVVQIEFFLPYMRFIRLFSYVFFYIVSKIPINVLPE